MHIGPHRIALSSHAAALRLLSNAAYPFNHASGPFNDDPPFRNFSIDVSVKGGGDPDVYVNCSASFSAATPQRLFPTRNSYEYKSDTASGESLELYTGHQSASWCLVSVYAFEPDTKFFITASLHHPSPPPVPPVPSPQLPAIPNCADWCTRFTCDNTVCKGCGLETGCGRPPSPPPMAPYEQRCDGSCFFISEYLEADEGSKNQFVELFNGCPSAVRLEDYLLLLCRELPPLRLPGTRRLFYSHRSPLAARNLFTACRSPPASTYPPPPQALNRSPSLSSRPLSPLPTPCSRLHRH